MAATNNLRAVDANQAWYQRQLASLATYKKTAAARRAALAVEEDQASELLKAQYSIDVANCYIKDA